MRKTACIAAATGLLAAATARATWSIILIDLRTGEVALGSATCLTGFDLRANTPVLLTGIGAATAQSFVDNTGQNRVFIRDRLALGMDPAAILSGLSAFDPGHQTRQYGLADTQGRAATFSGTSANAWAGGQTGQFQYTHLGRVGTVAYAIQGNILTGPCVVDAAVQAALSTPGDLPAKLMEAMQAARTAGGDGRCSCAGNPTGCGCPPTTFTKSSHIAYMLIARAGDRDGSTGIYRTTASPFGLASADFNSDQLPDFVTASTAGSLAVLTNTTPPGSPFATLALPANLPAGSSPRDVQVADMNGDTIPDLVAAHFSSNAIGVYPGLPGGQFGPRTDTPVSGGPQSLAIADFDAQNGPDVAVAHGGANNVWLMLANGAGGFSIGSALAAGSNPQSLVSGQLIGDPLPDLAVCSRNTARVLVYQNVSGNLAQPVEVFTPPNPTALLAADLDGDGDSDLVVGTQLPPSKIVILRNDGNGVFTPTTLDSPTNVAAIAAGDLDGDLDPDLLAALAGGQFLVLRNSAGAFAADPVYTVGGNFMDVRLGDHNADGDLDAAFASTSNSSVTLVHNLGDGTFSNGLGTATGDYFMNFNVAFTSGQDPDPVATLALQFADWRSDLAGRPDAVQSLATLNPVWIDPTPGSTSTMTIHLRDWQGQPITAPVNSLTVEHAPASAGATTIGAPVPQGQGQYTVLLTATGAAGIDRYLVTVDDGLRPVTLMPSPQLAVIGGCYADCNADGQLNLADFGCYQTRFALQDPYADCNGDTLLNLADFGCFQTRFALGCP